ncbi:sigma-70 family RNA polymerase sigma factor [Quadrisphaera sp. KR29]|uniref:sigma-70 family RNA polymerase sigma factor n=1 Tax=Quadrisphaera sp. KR29 TaxID=3461391 RepID=UPI004043AEA3
MSYEQALAALRADMERLADVQGRMPTPGQVHALLRRHNVDTDQLEAILAAMPAATRSERRSPPTQMARAARAATKHQPAADPGDHPPLAVAPRQSPPFEPHPDLPGETQEDEDEDWNDADPFAVTDSRSHLASATDDPVVEQVASDLQDDYLRAGALTMVDVTTLAHRRGLRGDAIEHVLLALSAAGVEVTQERVQHADDAVDDLDGGRVRRQVGAVERDQLQAYFASVGRIRLLDAAQEVRLGRAVQAGRRALESQKMDTLPQAPAGEGGSSTLTLIVEAGRQAHRKLVSANLRLVISVAKLPRYQHSGVDFADRIQDGNLGLIRAADKFDPELGYKFSTYATWWIRQSIDRGIGDRGRAIRLPIHMHDRVKKIRAVQARLERDLDRAVTLKDIADEVGMDVGAIAAAVTWSEPVISYDVLVDADDSVRLVDLISPGAAQDAIADPALVVMGYQCKRDLTRILDVVLTPREVEVLEHRYGLDGAEADTLDNIGDRLGVTRERIRQVQNKALKLLREDARIDDLYEYLVDCARSDTLRTPLGERAPSPPGAITTRKRRRDKPWT